MGRVPDTFDAIRLVGSTALSCSLLLVGLSGCEDRPQPEVSDETDAKIEALRKKVEESASEAANAIRRHNPDTGLDLPSAPGSGESGSGE